MNKMSANDTTILHSLALLPHVVLHYPRGVGIGLARYRSGADLATFFPSTRLVTCIAIESARRAFVQL